MMSWGRGADAPGRREPALGFGAMVVGVVAILVLVSACSSAGPSAAPSATPGPTPVATARPATPVPTPVDPALLACRTDLQRAWDDYQKEYGNLQMQWAMSEPGWDTWAAQILPLEQNLTDAAAKIPCPDTFADLRTEFIESNRAWVGLLKKIAADKPVTLTQYSKLRKAADEAWGTYKNAVGVE